MSLAESSTVSRGVGLATLTVSPNPVPWNSSATAVEWSVPGDIAAELCVVEDAGPEQIVARGSEGKLAINWIRRGAFYEFRLYLSDATRELVCSVIVEREMIPWHDLVREVATDGLGPTEELSAATFLGRMLSQHLVHSSNYQEFFRLWQKDAVHITPVHFYQPIPDTSSIPDSSWWMGKLPGLNLRKRYQLHLIETVFPSYRKEYNTIPLQPDPKAGRFYLENGVFEGLDSLVTYCMVRHFRPRRIIEIGGGYSSLVLARAALVNGDTALTTVEPFPNDFLREKFPGLTHLIEAKVETMPLEFFDSLGANDILFIDSSHVVKIGGDVNYLFLQVLPRLAPGTIVHVHDINFPFDYPKKWVLESLRFWTEQYLLQAFLIFNSQFEVLLSNSSLVKSHIETLRKTFSTLRKINGGSFWMRRKMQPLAQLRLWSSRMFRGNPLPNENKS